MEDRYGKGLVGHFGLLFSERQRTPAKHQQSLCGVDHRIADLKKDFAKNAIGLVLEYGTKNDRDSIVAGFDVDSFLLSIVDGPDLASFLYTLWCGLRGILCCFFLEMFEFVKGLLEWCCHGVTFEE